MDVEKKNKEFGVKTVLKDVATWTALFTGLYLAVLPMADTIALRNLALLGLLACVVLRFSEIRHSVHFGVAILLWAAYVLAFPLIATDPSTAWSSLEGQWGLGLLSMIAGAGAATILRGRYTANVFTLGLISAVPLLVHLVLFSFRTIETGTIPWGYWGRETHHADLGYAAGHVVILMTVSALIAGGAQRIWSFCLIAVALLSTVFAQSRAGLVFALLGGCIVLSAVYWMNASLLKRNAKIIVVVLLGMVALLSFATKEDPRWRSMSDQLVAGLQGDAIQIECQGSPVIEANIRATFGEGPWAKQLIDSVRDGDGARMVILRAGISLALKNPWGSDGSRQAFQKLLSKECNHPAIVMAHSHNGWIDTTLALGWLGGSLYLYVLISFLYSGISLLKNSDGLQRWGLVLTAVSLFWIIRGFTDSVFRDHMLEMQGFVLMFATVSANSPRVGRVGDN